MKIEQIVRENKIYWSSRDVNATIQSAEIWKESGR